MIPRHVGTRTCPLCQGYGEVDVCKRNHSGSAPYDLIATVGCGPCAETGVVRCEACGERAGEWWADGLFCGECRVEAARLVDPDSDDASDPPASMVETVGA